MKNPSLPPRSPNEEEKGKKVRTRFAPSPTGYLHVGGARTALFNYLYAKSRRGEFVLRIEDTDQARSTDQSYQQMIESMQWLGLHWDEGPKKGGDFGPYRQSERLAIYQEHAKKLLNEKKAFQCFCTTEELETKKRQREAMGRPPVYDGKCRSLSEEEIEAKTLSKMNYTIRFKTPNQDIIVDDMVQGKVKFDTGLIGDFIIVKSDGFPSYNFAVVIDDALMKISHVIRGVGHLSNTPRQILIFEALAYEQPAWAHVSEIVGSDHKKLSKRHGATAITAFRNLGYPPRSFRNYMALLGWSPPDGKEFIQDEQLEKIFDVSRCNKSPSMFDVFDMNLADGVELNECKNEELISYLFPKSKLNWLSNLTIREMPEQDYIDAVLPFVKESQKVPPKQINPQNENLRSILLSLRVYLDYFFQIGLYIGDFFQKFNEKDAISQEITDWVLQDFVAQISQTLTKNLSNIDEWKEDSIKSAITQTGKDTSTKGKNLFMSVRVLTTGKMQGLELPVYLQLLGREKVFENLKSTTTWIQNFQKRP